MDYNWRNSAKVLRFVMFLLVASSVWAQITGSLSLSGTVTDASGKAIRDAKVSLKNLTTSQSVSTQTDSTGHYQATNLTPADYELSVSAPGFSTNVTKVNVGLEAGAKTMDVTLGGTLSLGDLGFSENQAQGSSADQARLDRRSHMLQVHQRLGLITAAPLLATVISGAMAGGRSTSSTTRDLHAALGSATAGLYFTTAYYAIFAPKIAGTHVHGPIRVHKALAWVHGPGMILTPILGAIAFDQKSRGERVHGIASAHGAVAIITAGAYGASILTLSFKF